MSLSWSKFTAAAVQASPVLPLSAQKTTEKVIDLISDAAKQGARLIVFPETFIPAYPNFSVDLQKPNEWQENLRYLLSESIEVPGDEINQIAGAARDHNVYVCIGINERVKHYWGRLYNSQVFIDAKGTILGTRRKLLPTNREKVFWTGGDGTDLQVYETELGVLGGLICYEHLQPLFKYALMTMGEQIHCAVWPGWPRYEKGRTNVHVIDVSTRQYALEGQCFVIVSCMYIHPKAVPKGLFGNAAWAYFGGSGIIGPTGEYVAGPVYDKETIVYGEVDLSLMALRKSVVDVTGKDQRWDVVQLALKRNAYTPVLNEGSSIQEADPLPDREIDSVRQELQELKREIEMLKKTLKK
jgi:nitrilase